MTWKPSTILQQQPCGSSCVSTCIAMLLGVPANTVIERFHQAYRNSDISLADMLTAYGVEFRAFSTADRHLIDASGVYIVGAPSLNIEGGMHQVLVEFDDDLPAWAVFDPRQGAEGKKFYSESPEKHGELARALGGFSTDAFIPAAEVLRVRAAYRPCQHDWRRIASGEYECRVCGAITDEPDV